MPTWVQRWQYWWDVSFKDADAENDSTGTPAPPLWKKGRGHCSYLVFKMDPLSREQLLEFNPLFWWFLPPSRANFREKWLFLLIYVWNSKKLPPISHFSGEFSLDEGLKKTPFPEKSGTRMRPPWPSGVGGPGYYGSDQSSMSGYKGVSRWTLLYPTCPTDQSHNIDRLVQCLPSIINTASSAFHT